MSAALLVADSGPLIALARLDLLALPSRLFSETLVTATVWHEVTREPQPPEDTALSAALQAGWLRVVADPADLPPALIGARLDAGERSALALAVALQAAVLVDDRLRPLADALRASGYFLAMPLVQRTLAAIGANEPTLASWLALRSLPTWPSGRVVDAMRTPT